MNNTCTRRSLKFNGLIPGLLSLLLSFAALQENLASASEAVPAVSGQQTILQQNALQQNALQQNNLQQQGGSKRPAEINSGKEADQQGNSGLKDGKTTVVSALSDNNYPPMSFLNDKGAADGYDQDIVSLIGEISGISFNYKLVDWAKATAELRAGRVDVVVGMNKTEQRAREYDLTESYLQNKTVIFVRKNSTSINSLADLNGKLVAVQTGDLVEDFLSGRSEGIKVIRYTNQIEALNDLRTGRIDAVLGNYYVGQYWLTIYNFQDAVKTAGAPLLVTEHCLAVKKGNTELLSKLNEAILKAKKNGDIERLQQKWFDQKYFLNIWYEKNEVLQIIKYLGLVGSSILLLSLAFVYFLRLRISRATAELKEVNNYYRSLIENASDIILVLKAGGVISYYSPSFRKLLDYSDEELKAKTFYDVIHPADIPLATSLLNEKTEQTPQLISLRVVASDNRVHIFEMNINNLYHDDSIEGIIINARDITERVVSEKEIRMLAQTIRNISECVCITDMKNNVLFVNEAFTKTYGYTPAEIIDEHISILESPGVSKQQYKDIYYSTLRGGWQGEISFRTKAGQDFPAFMSTALVYDNKEIPIALVSVTTDITERKLAEQELIRAKEKAEKSDRLKSEFLAQMSHEIRTPVNAILSFTSLLRDELEHQVSDDLKSSFMIIDNGGRRLIRTIDLILNMSEIQAGNFEVNLKELDILKDILDNMMVEFDKPARAKGVELSLVRCTDNLKFYGDQYTVIQIFQNLLDNAIKYTPGGKVDVKIYNTMKHELCVDIKDTGIGISEEYLPSLFEPFSQEETGYTRRFEGNGLGLSLVKKYVALNNAEISVRSRKGEGSTFTVTFKV